MFVNWATPAGWLCILTNRILNQRVMQIQQCIQRRLMLSDGAAGGSVVQRRQPAEAWCSDVQLQQSSFVYYL